MHPSSASVLPVFRWLFRPIDLASLVVFRVAFGGIMAWEAVRYIVPRGPDGESWARSFYIVPQIPFKYFGFGWVHPWPGEGMIWHFWAWAVAAVCVAAGFCYRLAAVVLFVLVTHVFLLDPTRYLNHLYLICLLCFLLIFLPLNRAVSLDAMLRPAIRRDVLPAWTLWLLRFQLAIVYVFSAAARTNSDWLAGEPMRTWLRSRADGSILAPLLMADWAPYVFSAGGMLFDWLIIPLLLWRRTRPAAFCLAVGFHLANAYLFHIGVFPWLGIAATTLFLDPDWPRRLLRLPPARTDGEPFRHWPGVIAALGLYALVQLFLPLRHLLYPGSVSWTNEGHYFAWRMKLDRRVVRVGFDVVDPSTGRRERVDLNSFLTRRQQEVMAVYPDMAMQFAQYLADHYHRQRGGERPAVYADIQLSLNGRPMRPLIDPQVDLASRRVTLGPAEWIVQQPLAPLPAGR